MAVLGFIVGAIFMAMLIGLINANKRWETKDFLLSALRRLDYRHRVSMPAMVALTEIPARILLRTITLLRHDYYPIVFQKGGYYFGSWRDNIKVDRYLRQCGKHSKTVAGNKLLHAIANGMMDKDIKESYKRMGKCQVK
jgi:hypothetical protein